MSNISTFKCMETLRTQLIETDSDNESSGASLDSEEEFVYDEFHLQMFSILHSSQRLEILPRLRNLQRQVRKQLDMDLDFSTIQENDVSGELESPILIACKMKNDPLIVHQLVEYFLLNGASPKVKDHNCSALHYAVQNGYPNTRGWIA